MPERRALITGITGQDGSYLAELLLSKGYEVHGIVRRVALEDPEHRLRRLHPGAAAAQAARGVARKLCQPPSGGGQGRCPDECYHLAAQSFVSYSFDDEFSTLKTNINGTHYLLAAVKNLVPSCRFYFAGSSEMFGKADEVPQTESTRFHPRSTYGISKVAGFELTRNYREAYRTARVQRDPVQPRIAAARLRIRHAEDHVGSGPDSQPEKRGSSAWGIWTRKRDWGHAREYVEAMWLMLQQPAPDDYVVATGETHSVREFVEMAFGCLGLDYANYVVADPELFRPSEVTVLEGDASKAHRVLGWRHTTRFPELVREMVCNDCKMQGVAVSAS